MWCAAIPQCGRRACLDRQDSRAVDAIATRVGRSEGRFSGHKLAARGNDVEMRRLSVVYANGNPGLC